MYELSKRVQSHILPGEAHSRCLSLSSVLGTGSLYVVVYDNPDGLKGVHMT